MPYVFSRDRREFMFQNMDALIENLEKIMAILDNNEICCHTETMDRVLENMFSNEPEGAETEEAASFY